MSLGSTCLVTGARGFIGTHVAAEFAAAGYRVIGLDRHDDFSGVTDASIESVCMELPSPEFARLIETEQPEILVHLAGPASVADSMVRPRDDFEGTVGVLVSVLDEIRIGAPDCRVVVSSSAAVYGNPLTLPVREDAPRMPVSAYGFHKCLAEDVLREYYTLYGVRSCAARIFSAYGAGLRRQLLWDVCTKALKEQRVSLFGTGAETRDFVHVKDVAKAMRTLVECAELTGGAYNVAAGQQTSIAAVVEMLLAAMGPDRAAAFSGEQRSGDPLYWQADISALRALGFSPTVTLADGVADYARWFLAEAAQ